MVAKKSADLRPIDIILEYFDRELSREIDVIGVEGPDSIDSIALIV